MHQDTSNVCEAIGKLSAADIRYHSSSGVGSHATYPTFGMKMLAL
jgi:hypothetical protein